MSRLMPIAPSIAATGSRGFLWGIEDRKSTRLNSSHLVISYAVFCLKKKKNHDMRTPTFGHDLEGRRFTRGNRPPACHGSRDSGVRPDHAIPHHPVPVACLYRRDLRA